MTEAAVERAAREPSSRPAPRFTLCALPEAEARIASDLDAVTSAVRASLGASRLCATLLVGSYARGEGGVVADAHGRLGPHNDYDLVAVVSHGDRALRRPLAKTAEACTRRLGIDVDVWPIDRARMNALPPTLFWLDVAMGGVRVLDGDASVLAPAASLTPRRVPLEECARLLANRAIGLALTNLEHDSFDERVMIRHGHKAVLACGDALLLAADRYAPTLRARRDALEALRGAPAVEPDLLAAYAAAIAYRTRPDRWQPEAPLTLRAWYEATRARIQRWHLRFDAWRVGSPSTPAEYARWRGRLFPNLPDVRPLGALAGSLRARATGAASFFPYLGHPRERLARVAVALGYALDDAAARSVAAELLGVEINATGPSIDTDTRARLRALVHRGG